MPSKKLERFSVFTLASCAILALSVVGCSGAATPAPDGESEAEVTKKDEEGAAANAPTPAEPAAPAATGTTGTTGTPAGTAAQADPAAPVVDPAAPIPTATDDALVAQLNTTMQGVRYFSEAEFGWNVIAGDGTGVTDITPQVVAERLGVAIAGLDGGQGRDLASLQVEEGDAGFEGFFDSLASDPQDPAGPNYLQAKDLIRGSLQGAKIFFFDITPWGQQNTGPIITVVVGRSASNKLVALVTFQVAT